MEARGLGTFMASAGAFGTLLFHPASPVARAIPDPLALHALMGALIGPTAAAITYSPCAGSRGRITSATYPWPCPDSAALPLLDPPTFWQATGFTGAVPLGRDLRRLPEREAGARMLLGRMAEACAAALGLAAA